MNFITSSLVIWSIPIIAIIKISEQGLIVMSTAIHHTILTVIMRQMSILAVSTKSKLYNLHTRIIVLIKKLLNLRKLNAQVLCNKLSLAK